MWCIADCTQRFAVILQAKKDILPKYSAYYHSEELGKFPTAKRPLSGREACES